jgi:hypothetical protein
MMFAAVVRHCFGRATPSLCNASPQQSMEIVRRETIYRHRNAVQANPATSMYRGNNPLEMFPSPRIGHRSFTPNFTSGL